MHTLRTTSSSPHDLTQLPTPQTTNLPTDLVPTQPKQQPRLRLPHLISESWSTAPTSGIVQQQEDQAVSAQGHPINRRSLRILHALFRPKLLLTSRGLGIRHPHDGFQISLSRLLIAVCKGKPQCKSPSPQERTRRRRNRILIHVSVHVLLQLPPEHHAAPAPHHATPRGAKKERVSMYDALPAESNRSSLTPHSHPLMHTAPLMPHS